jgi:hypothetical protein
LVLELVSKFEVLIHEFGGVLLWLTVLIFFLLLRRLGASELILVGHLSGLEEVKEALNLNSLGDGLTWLTLLGLLLLLDLLLSDILAIFPLNFSAFALFNHVLILGHHERLLELSILEVVILLKGEDQVVAIAGVMNDAINIKEMQQNWTILLLNEASNTAMVEHGTHPESWHTKRAVLDLFHIAGYRLQLLVVFVIKFLGTSLINLEQLLLRGLGTSEDLIALSIDLFVEFVILELKCTVESLLFLIKLTLLILILINFISNLHRDT